MVDHPNALKTWLIVNDEKLENATTAFEGTGVNITSQGKRHLGAALGTRTFVEEYVQRKVADWVDEVERLSDSKHSSACRLCRIYKWSEQ